MSYEYAHNVARQSLRGAFLRKKVLMKGGQDCSGTVTDVYWAGMTGLYVEVTFGDGKQEHAPIEEFLKSYSIEI
jgi:hypothetical protein